MITVMGLIQTATDLSDTTYADNEDAMRRGVGDLSLDGVFNRVVDNSQKGINYARGGVELDAVTQFFFNDISASMTAASMGSFNFTMGLSGPMVAEMHSILCLQNTVVAPPAIGQGLKRMSILRKRPDVSSEEFQKQWFELHGLLVERLPGLAGYRQNLVLDGPRCADGHMMVDGMVELWFPDGETIDSAFQSDIGNTTMMHAKEFIAEISTFLVEPHCVRGLS